MNWKELIRKDAESNAVAAQSESFNEGLAEMTQDLIDDLQQAISSGKVTEGRLSAVFKKHGIKFNVLQFNYGEVDYPNKRPYD